MQFPVIYGEFSSNEDFSLGQTGGLGGVGEEELAGNWKQMLRNAFSPDPKRSPCPRVWGTGWGHGASRCLHCPQGAATGTNPISSVPEPAPKRAGWIQLDEALQSFCTLLRSKMTQVNF